MASIASRNQVVMKRHILVVDDEIGALTLIGIMLERGGFDVLKARDARAALEILEDTLPDLIILDVMMPGMNGWETCEKLKAEPSTTNIPIIMLTSLDGVDVPARARQAGASAVLMKPCPEERLLLTISATRRSADPRSATHRN